MTIQDFIVINLIIEEDNPIPFYVMDFYQVKQKLMLVLVSMNGDYGK
jgi:hypothetical protein